MKYGVIGAIALALILHWVGVQPSNEPGIEQHITLPWWLVPMSPLLIFVVLVVRRLLKRSPIKERL